MAMPLLLMVVVVMVCLLGGLPRHLGVAHAAAGEPEGPDCDLALKILTLILGALMSKLNI